MLRDQVAGLMNQFNALARDAGYDGQQVLTTGSTAALTYTVNTNVSGSTSVTIAPVNLQVGVAASLEANFTLANTGLTVTTTATQQTFTGTTTWLAAGGTTLINNTVGYFTNILTGLQTAGSNIATQSAVLDIRKSFTKDAVRANNEFADYLTLADINEEGANLTSLQTKQQLAVSALSLAGRTDQAILRLF